MTSFGGRIRETRGGASRGFLRLATTQSNQVSGVVRLDYEQLSRGLRRQAEQIARLDQGLRLLQSEQQQLEEAASHLAGPLENCDGANAISPSSILACIRKIAAAANAGQIFELLVQEAASLKVRTAVFGVCGRAAGAISAWGFDPEISSENIRELVVSLNHDGPFCRVFETAEPVQTNAASFDKNPNVLAKLGASANSCILLAPVRSAGSVAAILYADIGEKRNAGLIESLQILAEFAGAQMDRLMALSGVLAGTSASPPAELAYTVPLPAGTKLELGIAVSKHELVACEETAEGACIDATLGAPAVVSASAKLASTALATSPQPSGRDHAASNGIDIGQQTEAEEKIHRDARRFARLLVSEIELYNKSSAEEGRRNKDLYQRLKKDIDRSRETYEKRFVHTVAREVDYFHEELVRTLAHNDPLLLGSGYPGPSE